MRSLRQTITTLGPAIILVSVLCGNIRAQSGLTTIQDTLFDADGSRYNGSLFIQWSTFDSTNPGTIVQQSKTVQVVNGNLLVQLAANNTATPPANVYTVLYQSDGDQQYTETWTVPFSATPLKVSQVRVGTASSGSAGGLSEGGTTGPVTEAQVTNLVSDLNARPIKGPGYGTNAVAFVDQNGQLETAVGNLGDCVFIDGTTGPCAVTLPTFVNGEIPGGAINGVNATFTLANIPSGTSLLLFRNGILVQAGIDYSLTGSTVQFLGAAIPQPSDTLVAEYRLDSGSGGGSSVTGTVTGPSGVPGVNGCGAVGTTSESAAYQIQASDNGFLLIQTAAAGFTLPATAPAAGWCVVLLDTNASGIVVGNNGDSINGKTVGLSLQPGNTIFVTSDGTGYWTTGGGGNGATGAGSMGANAEYSTSQTMTLADCPSSLKTFTGAAALSYTLIAPEAGCNIDVQNNTGQLLTINAVANSVTINGQTANITIPACPAQPSGCPDALIKANGATSWDMSLSATVSSSGGGSGGGSGAIITREAVFASGGGSVIVTHNLNTSTPLIGQAIVNSGCGTCYTIGSFTSNTFTVTSSQAADLIFPLVYVSSAAPGFGFTVVPVAASEFQSGSVATYTVTQTATGPYTGTVTLSCASVSASGVTCAFSPAVITASGTSTLTVTASASAAIGAGTFVVSGTDGVLTSASPTQPLTIWKGPIQQWNMNEGTSPMADSSGNPNNLTNSNATYGPINGLLSNTVTYNGATRTIAANDTNTNFTGQSPFSVCVWENEPTLIGADPVFVSTLQPGNGYKGWELGQAGGNPKEPQFWLINNLGAGNFVNVNYAFSMQPNAAYHFCVAYDGTGSTTSAIGYINGALVSGVSGNTLTASAANGQNVFIGSRTDGSIPMSGGIADVRIFNYQLSAAQVAAIYAAGVK